MRLFSQVTCVVQAVTICAAVSLLGACQANGTPEARDRISYGEAQAFGSGTARTYLVQDTQGRPLSIGIEVSEDALSNLPPEMVILPLPLPEAAMATQYTFAMLDWMPHGHEPENIYTSPHFDFHFYMEPQARIEEVAGGIDPVVLSHHFVPTDYISPGNMSVPAMGVHWVDRTSPELNGEAFDKTFMYGASMGDIVFLEPMVTLAFLSTRPDFSEAVKQPEAVQKAGYYPRHYSIRYLNDLEAIRVSLDDLVLREPAPSQAVTAIQ